MSGFITKTIPSYDEGMSVLKWFQKYFKVIPKSLLHRTIRNKAIRVNGKKVTLEMVLHAEDIIKYPNWDIGKFTEEKQESIDNEWVRKVKETILYEDKNIIAINKLAGIASQGGDNILISIDRIAPYICTEKDIKTNLVHRLDRETTGVMLIAKNYETARLLATSFQTREVSKRYLALMKNLPPHKSGEIITNTDGKSYIIDHKKKKYEVDSKNESFKGCKVHSMFNVLDSVGKEYGLVEFLPITGRKHQIRIQANFLGGFIVGDKKYGRRERSNFAGINDKNLQLHSAEIEISSYLGKSLIIKASLPSIFKLNLNKLGLSF